MNDMRQGLGCQSWNIPNRKRQTYDGMWHKDQCSGFGVDFFGREHIKGQFLANNYHGFCTFQKSAKSRPFQRLEGVWEHGDANGKNFTTKYNGGVRTNISSGGTGYY